MNPEDVTPPPVLVERVPSAAAPIVIPDLRRSYLVRVWGVAGLILVGIDVGLLVWWWTL